MKPSSDLFELIKSLTKSEKRYFKRFCKLYSSGKENNYLKLFDVIDKQKIYDEKLIKVKFKNEKFIKQLNVTKNYLYNLILRSLRMYNEKFRTANSIAENTIEIDILARKRLFAQSEKLLKRTLVAADREENYIMRLELLRLKRQLLLSGTYHKNIAELERICINERVLCNDILTYNNNLLIESKLQFYISKIGNSNGYGTMNKNYVDSVKKIIKELNILNLNNSKYFMNRFLYLRICVQYYEFIGNYKIAYNYSVYLITLFRENKTFMYRNSIHFIGILYNHTWISLRTGQFSFALSSLGEIEAIIKDRKTNLSKNFYIKAFLGMCELKLYMYNYIGLEFCKEKNFTDLINIFAVEKNFDKTRIIGIYYYLSINYLIFGYPEKALECLNTINNKFSDDLFVNLKISSTVILGIIHFELDNFIYLDDLITKSVKFYKKKYYLNSIELEILRVIQDISNCLTEKGKLTLFSNLKKKILKHPGNEIYVGNMKEFDIISWIDSKIEKRSFKEIVREKANNLLE